MVVWPWRCLFVKLRLLLLLHTCILVFSPLAPCSPPPAGHPGAPLRSFDSRWRRYPERARPRRRFPLISAASHGTRRREHTHPPYLTSCRAGTGGWHRSCPREGKLPSSHLLLNRGPADRWSQNSTVSPRALVSETGDTPPSHIVCSRFCAREDFIASVFDRQMGYLAIPLP